MGVLAGWEIEFLGQQGRTEGEFKDRADAFEYLKKRFSLPKGMNEKQIEKRTNTLVLPFFQPDYDRLEPWV